MRILFVCTGNICRSPLAERLATVWAEQSLGSAAATVVIRSAGTEGLDGRPMDRKSGRALMDLGGDPTGFAARPLLPVMADRADLVLTMTRKHRRLVLAGAPRALRRTFTLPEAASLLEWVDTIGLAEMPLQARAQELAARLNDGRARRRTDERDDVEDPIGQSATVHADVAGRIAANLRPLADILFAPTWSGAAWSPNDRLVARA
jgi:protein-tyrosine phosphatase